MTPAEAPAGQRLFFALWPDETVRMALAELAREETQRNGRTVPAGNIHITLAFLGQIEAAQQTCMETAADAVTGTSFELIIGRLGFWPRPRILWAGAATTPAPLLALVADLNRRLVSCGYEPERRPYQAHVTLARKARRGPQRIEIPPLVWPVAEFCLVASVTEPHGSRYEVLRRWPLSVDS